MNRLRMFQFKSKVIESPDDIAEVVDMITDFDDARDFITRLANHLTYGDVTISHLHHACFLVLSIGRGDNPVITSAVLSLW
jgi:hypothetical protein